MTTGIEDDDPNDAARSGTSPTYKWLFLAGDIVAIAVALRLAGHPDAGRLVLVLLSTGLSASSAIPSILASRADPASLEPATWAIWSVLTAVGAVASAVSGDYPSAVFAAVGAVTCGAVAAVSLRQGRRMLTPGNGVCVLIAAAGLYGWLTADQPSVAVLAACVGDLAALYPTIRHAWQHPDQEPTATYVLIAAGGLCTVAAAWGHWTVTAIAYPLYVTASTGTVALLTLRRPNPSTTPAIEPTAGTA
jgi:hypothetical protein